MPSHRSTTHSAGQPYPEEAPGHTSRSGAVVTTTNSQSVSTEPAEYTSLREVPPAPGHAPYREEDVAFSTNEGADEDHVLGDTPDTDNHRSRNNSLFDPANHHPISDSNPQSDGVTDVYAYARKKQLSEDEEDALMAGKDREAARRRARNAGFCCQLGITIKRMLILMTREPCSFICELLIPIIFVIGSIVLWAIFGNDKIPATDYFNENALNVTSTFYEDIRGFMCYNATITGGAPIGDLVECDTLMAAATAAANENDEEVEQLYCADPVSGAPKGFCALGSVVLYSYEPYKALVWGNSTYIPTLDEFVPLQWLHRMLYDQTGLDTIWDNSIASAMFSTGTLYISPDTPEAQAFADYLVGSTTYFPYVFGGVKSFTEAEDLVRARRSRDPPNWGILQFNSFTPDSFDVSIRLNASALPRTKNALDEYYVGGLCEDCTELYIFSGFTTLQTTVYQYYLTQVLGVDAPPEKLVAVPAPTVEYREQKFLAYGGQLAPLILVLGFLYPVSMMTKRIVLEKELRLREAMLIMGLTEAVMYTAWLVIYVVQYAVVSLIMTILLKVTYTPKSNFGIIFFLFFFFCLSTISLAGLIGAFFNKARLSSILSPLIYFVLSIPLFAMQDAKPGARTGIMFLSPSGLAVGIGILFDHELAGGMFSDSLTYFRDKPNMLLCLIVLFVDFLIYALLMLYFDAVLPKDWGTRKHPLFFIVDPFRACCGKEKNYENEEDGRATDGVFEPVPDGESHAIRIVGLRKQYGSGKRKFLAVDNLHWGMREGEISVLLGHNGAGKTTTMNMMTGMVSADAGDCYIYGRSVRRELGKARQEIGFCPQHNILWPYLTVREHLWYYASIKGLRGEEREQSIKDMLDGVDFVDKEHYKSTALSGGQKRKLSVAIAFVGGSRLVFLDEPTAGMDVGARRHTWGLLRTMSQRHSILLTTHFMDEADLLGDSVAIMSKGRLQCAGSNMFLKSKLGVGYVLVMSVVAHVNRGPVEALVRGHVPVAQKLGSGAGEMAYRLPMSAKSAFPELLADIEDNGKDKGINGFSMSATTLEEIFIRIAKGEEEGASDETREGGPALNDDPVLNPIESKEREEAVEEAAAAAPSDVWNVQLMEGECSIMWSQFKAMLQKRFWNVLRDRRTQFFQIICPVACVLLAMLLMLVKLFQSPTITVNSDIYETSVVVDVAPSCASALNLSQPFSSNAYTLEVSAETTADLSQYELETYYDHYQGWERYGGLVCDDPTLLVPGASVVYNTSALHEMAIVTYNLYNGFLMKAKGAASALVTKVEAMPKTETEEEVTDSVYAMMIAIIIMIPFTFIPSTFVSWVVKERQCKARHLQNVSGLFFSMYWLTNFIFDVICYLITMFLVIIVFLIFSRDEYVGKDSVGATILVFFLYGLSGIAMAYAVSFAFNDYATAQNTVMLANFIAGFLLVLCITMLSIIDSTEDVAKILRWIFRIVPSYCVGEGISNLAVLKMEKAFGTEKTAFSMDVTGWPMVYMALEIPFFAFITLFIDHPSRRQRSQRLFHDPDAEPEVIENEDPDVVAEREEVLNDPERASDLVAVKHLRKKYPNGKVAVRDLTFGVKPGEVFGFLGTNGAGKTTTISILCQEFYPTSGHGSICGFDIVNSSREALRCIGYCPQFDATLDLLTVEEHLKLYAGVRAIDYAARDKVVKGLMTLCELNDYKKTKAHELSGGNRRKLSVAMSLIGGPRVVFLDEPSAGMDPVARRGLWTAIETVADNCSVVLTTHHLEEVEALAHRVAIMVDGALECIGNKTHLKTKFGTGFEINVRVDKDTPELREAIERFFAEKFEGSRLREYRARRFTYELPGSTKLSETFRLLEENATELHVTDYNVSQTSIEQVFLQISEEAERRAEAEHAEEMEKKSKCCACCNC